MALFLPFLITNGLLCAQNLAKAVDAQIVIGTGTRVNINGGITFAGTSNLTNNGTISLNRNTTGGGRENWVDSTSNVMNAVSTGTVQMQSDSLQYIIGPTKFYSLTINADSGVAVPDQPIEIRNQLNLDKGLLFTTAANYVHVSNPLLTAIQTTGSFNSSYVNGVLWRSTNTNTGDYLFPIGKIILPDSLYAPVKIRKLNSNAAVYKTEYFPAQPTDRLNFLNPPIDHISDVEYWHIESDIASGTGDDAAVSLSWRPYSQVSVNNLTRDSLLVTQYINNSGFRWEAMFNTGQANIVSGTPGFGFVTSNVTVGSFTNAERRFTLGSRSPFNLLPVELLFWDARLSNSGTVDMEWRIDKDQEALKYEVEKSLSGNLFATISSQQARRRSGIQTYTAQDLAPAAGFNYYRLKIYGNDNRYFYSGIKKIWVTGNTDIRLYPNPVNDRLFITQQDNTVAARMVTVYDATGKLVLRQQLSGNTETISTSGWASGLFTVQVTGDNNRLLLNKMVLKQ